MSTISLLGDCQVALPLAIAGFGSHEIANRNPWGWYSKGTNKCNGLNKRNGFSKKSTWTWLKCM